MTHKRVFGSLVLNKSWQAQETLVLLWESHLQKINGKDCTAKAPLSGTGGMLVLQVLVRKEGPKL